MIQPGALDQAVSKPLLNFQVGILIILHSDFKGVG